MAPRQKAPSTVGTVACFTVGRENCITRPPDGDPRWELADARVQFNPERGEWDLICIWTGPGTPRNAA